MRGADQEVARTASRRSGPRRWLDAVRWLIAAGYHGVNATTLRVAEDLASRMDYDLGHVLYRLKETAKRLGMSVSNLKKHVKKLRELGALVWVVHGTRTNIRRLRGLSGYAGTATVYGAVIPPEYDHAKGHILIGSGYDARIIIDERGKAPTLPTPRNPVDNPPVENPGAEGREPPSRTGVDMGGEIQDLGGFNYTPRAGREDRSLPRQQTEKRSSGKGQGRTASMVKRAHQVVRRVRPLVNWTQRVPQRRLEFVLRPLTDRGLDERQIADELHGMTLGWQPVKPAEFIQARLAAETARQTELAAQEAAQATAVRPEDNQAWSEYRAACQALSTTPAEPERTDDDRRHARLYAWQQWQEVADHYADDPDDALDLYGHKLVRFAVRKQIDADERTLSYA